MKYYILLFLKLVMLSRFEQILTKAVYVYVDQKYS